MIDHGIVMEFYFVFSVGTLEIVCQTVSNNAGFYMKSVCV